MRDSIPKTDADAKPADTGLGNGSTKRLLEPKAKLFAQLSRNFAHWPLVRSPAATPAWETLERKGKRYRAVTLHSGKVRAMVPQSFADPRLPDVSEWDVAAFLLAKGMLEQETVINAHAWRQGGRGIKRAHAERLEPFEKREGVRVYPDFEKAGGASFNRWARQQAKKNRHKLPPVTVSFKSMRALAVELGMNPTKPRTFQTIRDALRLLKALRAEYAEWYTPTHQNENNQRIAKGRKRKLVRFITAYTLPKEGERGPVTITLARSFMETARSYTQRVMLPLPADRRSPVEWNVRALMETFLNPLPADQWQTGAEDEEEPERILKRDEAAFFDTVGIPQDWRPARKHGEVKKALKAMKQRRRNQGLRTYAKAKLSRGVYTFMMVERQEKAVRRELREAVMKYNPASPSQVEYEKAMQDQKTAEMKHILATFNRMTDVQQQQWIRDNPKTAEALRNFVHSAVIGDFIG